MGGKSGQEGGAFSQSRINKADRLRAMYPDRYEKNNIMNFFKLNDDIKALGKSLSGAPIITREMAVARRKSGSATKRKQIKTSQQNRKDKGSLSAGAKGFQ